MSRIISFKTNIISTQGEYLHIRTASMQTLEPFVESLATFVRPRLKYDTIVISSECNKNANGKFTFQHQFCLLYQNQSLRRNIFHSQCLLSTISTFLALSQELPATGNYLCCWLFIFFHFFSHRAVLSVESRTSQNNVDR